MCNEGKRKQGLSVCMNTVHGRLHIAALGLAITDEEYITYLEGLFAKDRPAVHRKILIQPDRSPSDQSGWTPFQFQS